MEEPRYDVTSAPAQPGELVSFTVVLRPKSGITKDELMTKLSVNSFDDCVADVAVLASVANHLRDLHFEVFVEDTSLDVSARTSVARFEEVFQTRLEKRIRTVTSTGSTYTQEWFVVKQGAPEPLVSSMQGALFIALSEPPIFFAPRLPPSVRGSGLRVPGDIAQLMTAAAVHRRKVGNDHATGGGIKVAVIDTGFFPHPYYEDHRYHIVPVSARDARASREQGASGHGTGVLASLFACAPDVTAIAVTSGDSLTVAIDKALTFDPQVISLSWGYDGRQPLPSICVAIAQRIVKAVLENRVVVAAGGNFAQQGFPAMMPEVLAVGGVAVDGNDHLSASNDSSSFTHPAYPKRQVPDVCGLSTDIVAPGPDSGWRLFGGTSSAAPQVAAVCALLLQQKPALTPRVVRSVLLETAADIATGSSGTGQPAVPHRPDLATGAGVVDALAAWSALSRM